MDTERLARRRKNIDGLDWETTYEMVLGIVTRLGVRMAESSGKVL
jgi:hypothetical protein